jgi:hypothetical protein
MSLSLRDAQGQRVEFEPTLDMYKAAGAAGLSVEQYVNQKYATDTQAYGTAYRQVLASAGLVLVPNREVGLLSNTMAHAMGIELDAAGSINRNPDASAAALRTLFPTAILTAIEDRLLTNLQMNPNAFEKMVAITDVVSGDKFERPILNYDNPTQARSMAISQLAEPAVMLSITTSSVTRAIPTLSLGMTISDQAAAATTLDLVSLAMSRQVAVERSTRVDEYLVQMLQGDADAGSVSLSSAGYTVNASTLDSTSTGGTLTQKAWIKFLYRNSRKRQIDWVVTDIDGALAIENRTGRPTNSNDNPNSPRIDSVLRVGNPTWNDQVTVFITNDPNWPAGTIMGLDSKAAIHRVQSSTAQYQAVEEYVMRRAKSIRVDFGEIAYRLYDEAFDVLLLA